MILASVYIIQEFDMDKMDLNEIQISSLAILEEFDRICKQKRFVYWITAGTLLGAIRHGGFIPWDDDIDVAMPRTDYEKLINYLTHDYNNPGYEIHTFKNNDKYPYYISRFCDTKHLLVFDGYDYSSGCFVDIYPYDGMGKEHHLQIWKKDEKYLQIIQRCLKLSQLNTLLYGNTLMHKIVNIPQIILCKMIGREYFLNILDKMRIKYSWEESDYVGVISWSTGTYCYPKQWFEKMDRIAFENIYVNIPSESDKYLHMLYGDYMVLPPVNKRVSYHGYTAYKK